VSKLITFLEFPSSDVLKLIKLVETYILWTGSAPIFRLKTGTDPAHGT